MLRCLSSSTPASERLRAWLPAMLYMVSIFAVSSVRLELPADLRPMHGDKVIHALEYAILGYLCAQAALRTWSDRAPLRAALVGLLIALGFGLSDELHQAFVPGRSADALDLLADGAGATLGAAARLVRRNKAGAAIKSDRDPLT